MAGIESQFPGLIADSNSVLFRLRCQQFIEIIRAKVPSRARATIHPRQHAHTHYPVALSRAPASTHARGRSQTVLWLSLCSRTPAAPPACG